MNGLALLTIVGCLLGSELVGSVPASDWLTRLIAVLLTAMLVPGVAFFQTSVLIQKLESERFASQTQNWLCHRLTVVHAVVWMAASAAIIWGLRWPDLVRGNWRLDRWPLLDEAIILSPILISMTASWAIFYDLQQRLSRRRYSNSDLSDRHASDGSSRLEFVSLRFRLFFLMALIPVGAGVLMRDLSQAAARSGFPMVSSAEASSLVGIAGLSVLMLGFPFLMLAVWKSSALSSPLAESLDRLSRQHRLNLFAVRMWHTNHQLINAAVVGFAPFTRIIFLSDGLLQQFDDQEVHAIFRHEAGHIRRHHFLIRLLLLVAPILIFASCGMKSESLMPGMNSTNGLQQNLVQFFDVTPGYGIVMILLAALYYWFVMRWVSHQFEHDADLYAMEAASGTGTGRLDSQQSVAILSALRRLASVSPAQLNRGTWLHPSLQQRIDFVNRISQLPEQGIRFRQNLMWNLAAVALVLVAFALAVHAYSRVG